MKTIHCCSVLVLLASLSAQQFVADLDPAPAQPASAQPDNLIAGNGRVWFAANTPDAGRELWVSDGTVAGTRVIDLVPGSGWSSPQPLIEVGGLLLLQARDDLAGNFALWVSNGTALGTTRLATVATTVAAQLRVLGTVNGHVVLTEDGAALPRIWSTDLTPAGTNVIGNGVVTDAIAHGTELLLAYRSSGSDRLFATDGTTFVDRVGIGGSFLSGFARLGAFEYFVAQSQPQLQATLCRTDGTAAGTTVVAPIGTPANAQAAIASTGTSIVGAFAGALFASNGTAAGTTAIAPAVAFVYAMTSVGTRVFFVGSTAAAGNELWSTDGTTAGTGIVQDFTPGPTGTTFGFTAAAPGRLFTFAMSGASGAALMSTDGTAAGTRTLPVASVGRLAPLGSLCIATMSLTVPADLAVFATDATANGTRLLAAGQTRPGVTSPGLSTALGETLFFVANDAAHGAELWRSDGTALGTQLVADRVPGPASGMTDLARFRGDLWFTGASALLRSDGTAAGTTVAVQPDPTAIAAGGLVAAADAMLFTTQAANAASTSLWRTDGTVAGTQRIATANMGFPQYRAVGARTFFTRTNSFQPSFACHDGVNVTTLVAGAAVHILGEVGGRVVFARDAANAFDVLITDGTVAGTQLLGHVTALFDSAAARDGVVVFVDSLGRAFTTDGVAFTALTTPRVLAAPAAALGAFYLLTGDSALGRVLWRTDGTVAGTAAAVAMGNQAAGVVTVQSIAAGNRLLLGASDGVIGVEPWISDGTQAGTVRLADLAPNGSSNPQLLGVAGHRAFLLADDGVRGRELWSFDLGAVGAANVQEIGRACAGSQGLPTLTADGAPLLGNGAFALQLDRAAASSLMVWLGGFGIGGFAIGGGCDVLPANITFTLWTFTDALGHARLPLAIPPVSAFVGTQLTMQASSFDPAGSSSFGSVVTPGLLLVVGR